MGLVGCPAQRREQNASRLERAQRIENGDFLPLPLLTMEENSVGVNPASMQRRSITRAISAKNGSAR